MAKKDGITFIVATILMVAGGFRAEWGVLLGCPWWHHLTFHFVHGNVFHLLCNLFALFMFCRSGRFRPTDWLLGLAFATAFSFIIPTRMPLVGFSGVLMYCLGLALPSVWRYRKARISMYLFLIISAASLFFNQWAAFFLHALCIAAGILTTKTKETIHDIKDQEERTHGRGG
jgi:membrane associated rhomboid family serine protease